MSTDDEDRLTPLRIEVNRQDRYLGIRLGPDGRGSYTTCGHPDSRHAMTHVDVTVPDGLLAALKKAPHEVAAELRLAAAIHWYQQSLLSMERAAETAGMTRAEFLAELARRRVDVFVVDDQDLARELGDV